MRTAWNRRLACLVAAGVLLIPVYGQAQAGRAAGSDQAVPKDLRPLLLPRHSEMRLVALRYNADRATLNGNFAGASRGGAFRPREGAAQAPAAFTNLSPQRIARLKRFDMDWLSALDRIEGAALSAEGKADLETLRRTVDGNLAQLDADATVLGSLAPVMPFAGELVDLIEARIRLENMDPQRAAGVLTAATRKIAVIRARVEAGLSGAASADALRVDRELAARTAAAVETLRAGLTEWFTFYNGYDPLFTWWMGLPFKHADTALQEYAKLLGEKVAPSALVSNLPAPAATSIAPAPAPKFDSVPNLQELIALPHDEMAAIVQRFRGPARGRGGRGVEARPEGAAGQAGVRPGQPQPAAARPEEVVRDRAFYQNWLKALGTLNFDKLSRPAQVDYLYIRKSAEQQVARFDITLPENPPRKTDNSGITGPARGRQGLIFDLQDEFIPYTPEQLIAIGDKELEWCEAEMRSASRELGFGDDWKKAVEHVKGIHPPPGGQAGAVRDLMFEAVDYLRAKDLLTVPAVAAESLHMIMMTPERQLVNPFFTGGSQISVSYPTDTMEYDARIQSMRGNNTPFSHATAFHEMIPGHNLVFYVNARFSTYRADIGSTSFYGEGWPLYWEMYLYDLGFHDTPEKRIGALFWRMHRSARITFSLRFHMGQWSPQECVDFLVERLGHERDNAIAEVRRSFQGGYGPLYQAAYLLGGLQMRGMRKEVVEGGVMSEKAFHDEVLRQCSMPIALLRLALNGQKLTRDKSIDWQFYGPVSGS